MFKEPKIHPFKLWCQKVLPLVYDNSLSYYEVLEKVVFKLNEVIEFVQTTLVEQIGELVAKYFVSVVYNEEDEEIELSIGDSDE